MILFQKSKVDTTIPQSHSFCKVKLEVDDVMVLGNSNENDIHMVDIA